MHRQPPGGKPILIVKSAYAGLQRQDNIFFIWDPDEGSSCRPVDLKEKKKTCHPVDIKICLCRYINFDKTKNKRKKY